MALSGVRSVDGGVASGGGVFSEGRGLRGRAWSRMGCGLWMALDLEGGVASERSCL